MYTHRNMAASLFLDNDNELVVSTTSGGVFRILIQNSPTNLITDTSDTYNSILNGWNRHCFTWEANSQFRVSL